MTPRPSITAVPTAPKRQHPFLAARLLRVAGALAAVSLLLPGCAGMGLQLPGSGPLASDVSASGRPTGEPGIALVDVDEALVRRAVESHRRPLLSEIFPPVSVADPLVAPGDVLEVTVWEAPPAALFGPGPAFDARASAGPPRASIFPEQVVGTGGTITIPFAGAIAVAGRSAQDVEQDIAGRLKGKAHDPQVLVRVLRSPSSAVTVVGEVAASTRMPLTPRGERLLDALAAAGGPRQPVGKVSVQVTRQVTEAGQRASRTASLPLDTLISDPGQNLLLAPGDVVTVLHQPSSLTVLGATARNEELNFEAQGITLAQALARAGGLQDARANPEAVFIFRFEEPAVLGSRPSGRAGTDGRIPVIYRANLRDPASFFTAQGFPIRNRDVLYVSNAPAAELQKFLGIVGSLLNPVFTLRALGD